MRAYLKLGKGIFEAMDFRAGIAGFFLFANFSFLEAMPAQKIFIKKKNSGDAATPPVSLANSNKMLTYLKLGQFE